MLQTVYIKTPNIVKRKIAEELILVPFGGVENSVSSQKKIFSLSDVGEYIYDCIDGVLTLEQILAKILDNFSVTREQAEVDILAFINDLLQHNIILERK